jgi:hypothetical protein
MKKDQKQNSNSSQRKCEKGRQRLKDWYAHTANAIVDIRSKDELTAVANILAIEATILARRRA